MNCRHCNIAILPKELKLKCGECCDEYHLKCLSNVTKNDFDYIVSSNSLWKCDNCQKVKLVRTDNTPVTPLGPKDPFFKAAGSGPDSDSSSGVKGKIACRKCVKGFAHNAFKAECVNCQAVYHLKCVEEFRSKECYLKVKSTWKCNLCVQEVDDELPLFNPASDVSLSAIYAEMVSFRKEVKKTNQDFKESMEKYSEWIVENGARIDAAITKIETVIADTELIRQENVNLKKGMLDLLSKVEYLEQAARENVLEIQNVPYVNKENLITVVKNISSVIQFDFNESMINKCYRYRNFSGDPTKPGGIAVHFVRNIDMQGFVDKRKQKRNLNTRDLGFMDGLSSVVYVNNSLTPSKRKLLRAAREFKNEKHYSFVWVSGGRIFLRKTEGEKAVEIRNLEDLEKLI